MSASKGTIISIIGLAVAVVAALWLGDPSSTEWPIKCPLYQMTGWQCPLCGMQRAVHEMCHGNVREAWMYNPAMWVSLPYFITLGLSALFPQARRFKIVRWARKDSTLAIVALLLVAWGIMRNL